MVKGTKKLPTTIFSYEPRPLIHQFTRKLDTNIQVSVGHRKSWKVLTKQKTNTQLTLSHTTTVGDRHKSRSTGSAQLSPLVNGFMFLHSQREELSNQTADWIIIQDILTTYFKIPQPIYLPKLNQNLSFWQSCEKFTLYSIVGAIRKHLLQHCLKKQGRIHQERYALPMKSYYKKSIVFTLQKGNWLLPNR